MLHTERKREGGPAGRFENRFIARNIVDCQHAVIAITQQQNGYFKQIYQGKRKGEK